MFSFSHLGVPFLPQHLKYFFPFCELSDLSFLLFSREIECPSLKKGFETHYSYVSKSYDSTGLMNTSSLRSLGTLLFLVTPGTLALFLTPYYCSRYGNDTNTRPNRKMNMKWAFQVRGRTQVIEDDYFPSLPSLFTQNQIHVSLTSGLGERSFSQCVFLVFPLPPFLFYSIYAIRSLCHVFHFRQHKKETHTFLSLYSLCTISSPFCERVLNRARCREGNERSEHSPFVNSKRSDG